MAIKAENVRLFDSESIARRELDTMRERNATLMHD